METNIRFTVHTDSPEYYQDDNIIETTEHVFLNTENPSEAMFTLLNMATLLYPIMRRSEPVELIIQESMSEQELQRKTDSCIKVTNQRYDTTEMKWSNCTICTEDYKNSEMVSVLSCGHVFHPKCIKEWGHYNPSCPLCKEKIPTYT
jgi:hypothetical protein